MENQEKQHRKKYLVCGCCGLGFYTWEGYQDQDQDAGYGICQDCQNWKQKKEEAFVEEAIANVLPDLKPENQKKLRKMTKAQKRYVVSGLIESGALQFKIKK